MYYRVEIFKKFKMITLGRELMKIARQFHGSKNIFGYKSTVANQMYLLYCFAGKIYFTDKIHKQVKCLWYGIISCQISFLFVVCWTYLWYKAAKNDVVGIPRWNIGSEDDDFIELFHVANVAGIFVAGILAFPLITFIFRDSIETMIDRVDEILTFEGVPSSNQRIVLVDAKKNVLTFLGIYGISLATNLSICFLDVVLFFEENKVQNYLYYAFPVFMIQKYRSIGPFFIVNGISTITFAMLALDAWLVLAIIIYWSTVWCDELIFLRDELNTQMRDLNVFFGEHGECSSGWNEAFECVLKRSIERLQKIVLLINDLREFFEIFGTVLISPAYFYSVLSLYIGFANDFAMVVIVKYVTVFLSAIVVVFTFYWIGQKLENSVFEVSMAIYSTPWYRLVKVRKNVYVFLCQTQSLKIFTIFKVHRLLMNNFSRYVHALGSSTNILLKLTNK